MGRLQPGGAQWAGVQCGRHFLGTLWQSAGAAHGDRPRGANLHGGTTVHQLLRSDLC